MEQANESPGVVQKATKYKVKQDGVNTLNAGATEPAQPEDKVLRVKLEQDVDKFEEYKLFVEDTSRLSERRQTVTYIYATINGAIVGLATVLFQLAGSSSWRLLAMVLPLVLAGLAICFSWYRLLSSYRKLLRFRFRQLEEMENLSPGSYRMYNLEAEHLYDKAPKEKKIEQSKIEMWLPRLFMIVYIVIPLLAILLVATKVP